MQRHAVGLLHDGISKRGQKPWVNRIGDVNHDYRETYFQHPERLTDNSLGRFLNHAAGQLQNDLRESDANTVVAVLGAATLFGFVRVSELMDAVKDAIVGRLLVFFPGEYEANNYRLLDARDGWN